MTLFRSFIFYIFINLFTIFYGSICLLIFPFLSANNRYKLIVIWCRIILNAAKIICLIHYRVVGLDNLPKRPVIILSKHQSAWETIAFPALFSHNLCFVLRKNLRYIPFFGWVLAMTQMIYIDRRKKHRAMMSIIQQGKKKLNHKFSIVIFPEGTRTSIGETGKYKLSGAYLAKETETPIIPIAHNSGSHWLRKSFFKKPGIITISIGHAIYPQNLTTTELNETTKNWIEDEMRRIDPYVYNNEKKTTNIP